MLRMRPGAGIAGYRGAFERSSAGASRSAPRRPADFKSDAHAVSGPVTRAGMCDDHRARQARSAGEAVPQSRAVACGHRIATRADLVERAALKRKLTTILSADVAGYSRLMSRDEEGTHARLAALWRELVEPTVDAREGTIFKKTGDGLLADFASVVEAVRCAIEIQRGAAKGNAAFPSEQHIVFRIGINLGDVIVEAGDIFGDGVNVAVRLEELAEPGEIVVSRGVRDHVRDRLTLSFEDMGEQPIKNISRPVRAFRIRTDDAAEEGSRKAGHRSLRRGAREGLAALGVALAIAGGSWWLEHSGPLSTPASSTTSSDRQVARAGLQPRLSIVVLPFTNLSGDARQDYFVDGITGSLTTDLSRALPGSFVVARGTAFSYKGKPVDARRVGRDLDVRYLLEGSVLTDGDRVRVNAQLIDTRTNAELWGERFDDERKGILEIQDQIVGRLSRAVGLELVDIEARHSERERSGNPSAVDFVMRGQAMANRPTSRETMIAARALFQRALEYDPDNVDALAGVATTYVFEVLNSYYENGRETRLREATALIRRALGLEPRHIGALKVHAALFRAEGKFDDAIAASQAVIAQNPGEPWAYKEVGLSELYLGRFREALNWFKKADRIGPRDPSRWIWLSAMGRVQFFLGRNEEAIRLLLRSADANPKDVRARALLAAIYALSGRKDDATSALASCLRLRPKMTIRRFFDDWSVPLQAASPAYLRHHERIREGLRIAGMPEE
jgi:adenylate cyclase